MEGHATISAGHGSDATPTNLQDKQTQHGHDRIPSHSPRGLSPTGYGPKAEAQADEFRRLSISPVPSGRFSPIPHGRFNAPGGPTGLFQRRPFYKRFWASNRPAILVALSQFFGATMNLTARLLELEGEGMHPVQVLFFRQSITTVCCLLYMWWMQTPDFPLGRKDIRCLLFARGFSGFFGIFGMWYSMMYLPLADATVITFLAPGVAGLICYFVLKEPFTRMEQLATLIALFGVVLIAQPAAFFAKSGSEEDHSGNGNAALPGMDHETTPKERLIAVGVALLGVFGAAGAFTTLRAIGKRAHPLISVNFFAMSSTVICVSALTFAPIIGVGQPVLSWTIPTSIKQWILLLTLGALGFIMQYLLTAGLGADKSNKANAMVYTHMIFAASFDRWVFGNKMGLMSFLGCALILGSAISVVLMKRPPASQKPGDVEGQQNITREPEASPMLADTDEVADEVNLGRLR